MDINDNPYIASTNYMAGYQDSIDKIKEDKNVIDVERLCFETFVACKSGKKLINVLTERYINAATPAQLGPNYADACIYFEGFSGALRMLIQGANSYKDRKEHESLEATIKASKGDES